MIKTLTHINNLSSFITHVAKEGLRRKAHAIFFLQDGIPRMVANGENLTVSTDLFTKLYTEPKCTENVLVENQFERKFLIGKTEIHHYILAKQFLPFPSSSIFQTTYSYFHFLFNLSGKQSRLPVHQYCVYHEIFCPYSHCFSRIVQMSGQEADVKW